MKNSLKDIRPDLASEWHPTKNGELKPEDAGAKSHKKVWWQCKDNPNHVWEAPPTNRNRKSGGGCPYCSNRMLSPDGSNSLANLFPDLANIWHPEKNGELTPDTVIGGGSKKHFWKCPEGDDHEWATSIHQLIQNQKKHDGTGCPVCRGLKVVKSNCLETTHPLVAKNWDYEKNKTLTPRMVTFQSNKEVFWKCYLIPRHKWSAKISNQVNSTIGCKYCHKIVQKSFEEMVLLFELKYFWSSINEEGKFIDRTVPKKYAKEWDIDIYIPELNMAIEYDGAYYHGDSDKRKTDIQKTSDLTLRGTTVIHVMQEPLKPINDKNDVVFSKFLGKNVVNLTLNKIIELGGKGLSKPLIVEIENYIYQDKLINENVREKFRVKHLEKVMKQREKKRFLNSKKIEYWDFVKAREFARSLKISSQAEWKKYAKESSDKPKEIPADPYSFYKGKGWDTWKDWLGITENEWREFPSARNYVHTLKLKNRKAWREYIYGRMKINKPTDIPNCPDKVYKNEGWSGYKDWLGHN